MSTSDSFTYRANDGTADSNLATVDITVVAAAGNAVVAYVLWEADTDTVIGPLHDGVTVNSAELNVNVEAVVADPEGATQNVVMSLSGATNITRTESVTPYMLAGDTFYP